MVVRKLAGLAPFASQRFALNVGLSIAISFSLSDCNGGESGEGSLPVTVTSVLSPEAMSSGQDSLIRIANADGSAVTDAIVLLNAQDVTAKFRKPIKGNGSLALLTGLVRGENVIEVHDANTSALRGELTLTAYALQGPILHAPQEQSLHGQTCTRVW